MAIGAKKITLPITNESTGTVSNVEYSFVQTDNTLAVSGAAADAKKTGDEITSLKQDYNQLSETKADKNSDNPEMGAGYASQLVSSLRKSDSVPYNFRKVPYDSTLEDGSIVGASVAWNQLVDKSKLTSGSSGSHTVTPHEDGSITLVVSGSSSSVVAINLTENSLPSYLRVPNGHKFAVLDSNPQPNGVTYGNNYNGVSIGFNTISDKTSSAGYILLAVRLTNATEGTYTLRPQITDLTQEFGTTIADYVYSLETATAGSGVAWLKEHFPKQFGGEYQAYNAGEIKSISGLSEHKSVGFNQFDKSKATTGKFVNNNGSLADDVKCFVTDYIRVLPNTAYYVNHIIGTALHTCAYIECDSDKNVVGWGSAGSGEDKTLTFTTGTNTHYIRVNGGTAYIDVTCINISKPTGTPKNGDYVAYEEHSYALDSTKTFRGILKLDSNNKLYADGDRYLPDGTLQRRYKVYDMSGMSSLAINDFYTGKTGVSCYNFNKPSDSMMSGTWETGNIICDKYLCHQYTVGEKGYIAGDASLALFLFVPDREMTATEALNALKSSTFIYEVKNPTTETAEPYQTPQIVDDWGTEEYVSTSLVPVGHDTKYANNLRAKLEMSPDSPEENGDYIVRHSNGENEYVALGSTTTIQGILDRLTALENA